MEPGKTEEIVVLWIAFGAIVLTLILGFTQGGWTSGGNAKHMAEVSAQNAIVERLAPICVAQFNADTQRTVRLEELKAVSYSGKQTTYVTDHGWATMPGEIASDNEQFMGITDL